MAKQQHAKKQNRGDAIMPPKSRTTLSRGDEQTATPQVLQKKNEEVERKGFTIREFCDAYRFSEALYFKLKRLGRGPREMHVLNRVVITIENAEEWARAQAAESIVPVRP